jgi:hypothetical protein
MNAFSASTMEYVFQGQGQSEAERFLDGVDGLALTRG